MQYKIFNAEPKNYSAWAKAELAKIGDLEERVISQKELLEIIPEIDILLIGWGLYINKEVLGKAKNLKVLASATTRETHIDLKEAKNKGVQIFTLKGQREILDKVPSTAEMAWALLFSLLRFIPWGFEAVKNYQWTRERFKGREVFEKTLGILGYGRLGRIMARQAKGFEMKVIACDPFIKPTEMRQDGVEPVDFEQLLKQSDILSLHCSLTVQTKQMINKDVFKKMKKSAYLINTARGELIQEKDLFWALENKEISGAGLDFLTNEWSFGEYFPKNNLVEYAKTHQNLLIAPHLGGMTHEAVFKVRDYLTRKIISFVYEQQGQ